MKEVRTVQRLWFAFASSQTVFPVVAFLARPPDAVIEPSIAGVLALLMVVESALGLVGVPRLFVKVPASSAFLIRFAIFEAVAIFGFVGAFLGASLTMSIGGSALSLMLLALTFPTEERYTAWEVRRLSEPDAS